jgi:ABC-type lipoprotein export system ATPase subunit
MLRLTNVTKTYDGNPQTVRAVDGVTLEIEAGSFLAVQGPSGCGKTTLLLIAGGLMNPDAGNVCLNGTDVYALPPDRRATFRGKSIGFVFQQFHLVPYLSVLDNVLAAALARPSAGSGEVRERAVQLIERLGLTHRTHHVPAALSTGERQRTALARALLNEPICLLADEPTGNLDLDNADVVLDTFAEFATAGGAVLLVTHDERAARRAERVFAMRGGRIEPSAAD